MMANGASRIDVLLRLAADHPESVLQSLERDPSTASESDPHSYSLLHAAASYGHIPLMKALVQKYNVDPNLTDEDGESPLFYAESLDVVKGLVEELGADVSLRNHEGVVAADKISEDGEGAWVPSVVEYLRQKSGSQPEESAGRAVDPHHVPADTFATNDILNRPERLPENVRINMGVMQDLPEGAVADPEIKRRIEELATKDSLDSGEAQQELRSLVTDIVSGLHSGEDRETQRRRLEE
jgi:uncharacterized protein